MTKQQVANQLGYALSDAEIEVLCHIWTNAPRCECSEDEKYVNLGVPPTEDNPNPFSRISTAMELEGSGLLRQHEQAANRFKLTVAGEKLVEAFYQ